MCFTNAICQKYSTSGPAYHPFDLLQATLPGEVIEGYQANKASKHRGFLHTLVRRSDGTYRSQLFRYDDGTAYVSTSGDITRVITCRRNGVAVNGKDLVNAVKMGGVECHANASVDDCKSLVTGDLLLSNRKMEDWIVCMLQK